MAALAAAWVERLGEGSVTTDAERRRAYLTATLATVGALVFGLLFALVLWALE